VHRIRSVEFRGLTAARAGGMCCCSRVGVRSRLPLAGRSRWLTSTEGASLRSVGGLRPLRTRCHMLGVGEIRCCDKRLRQWAVCVTLSAAPKTVTHAWRNAAFNAVLYIGVAVRMIAAGDTTAGQRIRKMGVSARSDESGPQPIGCRSYVWSGSCWGGCLLSRRVTTMPSSPGNNRRRREFRERGRETSYIFGRAAASSGEIQQSLLKKRPARPFLPHAGARRDFARNRCRRNWASAAS
jgi:hypothetical protein